MNRITRCVLNSAEVLGTEQLICEYDEFSAIGVGNRDMLRNWRIGPELCAHQRQWHQNSQVFDIFINWCRHPVLRHPTESTKVRE